METPLPSALREWFVTTGIKTLRPDFMEMLGISKETAKKLRKEAKQHKAAVLIQKAWRKYAAVWVCKGTDTCGCIMCVNIYCRDGYYDCPFCGDTFAGEQYLPSGYCSRECEERAEDIANYSMPQEEDRGSRWDEDPWHEEKAVGCQKCGRDIDGSNYEQFGYCRRGCFVSHED
jgi:hypothetical protein